MPRETVAPPLPFVLPVPKDYRGEVFVWDLDKTYLRSEFTTFTQLLRTAFQKAKDKVAYPGATALLRALRRGPDGALRPIYFVSASPPQLRAVIHEKFALDGVEVDGVYFKDNLRNVRPGRMKRLREHVGYKLLALLDLRRRLPAGAEEVFFGDDVETDVVIYALYGQILRGAYARLTLIDFLQRQGVFPDEAVRIAWRARTLHDLPIPERIYIHMHRTVDPRYYRRFGSGVRATATYFQTAVLLHVEGKLGIEAAAEVGVELLRHGGYTKEDLAEQLEELVRRRLVSEIQAVVVTRALVALGMLPA